jgi:hypothetical protein
MTTEERPLATLASTQKPNQALKKVLTDTLAKVHPNVPYEISETLTDVDVACTPDLYAALINTLHERKELSFDFLRNMSGMDWETWALA